MEKLIKIENCSVSLNKKEILSNVSLDVYDNDFIGIIGPNGGGKTTLVRMILDEIKPSSGTIVRYKSIETNIGYLPQYSNVDRSFPISLEEIVLSGLQSRRGIFDRYSKADKDLVVETMKMCSIDNIRKRAVGEVSGGELQRTYLCRAIISSPKLLILDEPNSYVDNKFENELYELLKQLNDTMAIMMVSHDIGSVTSYVKSIACVNRTLHYHKSSKITQEQLISYDCPILLVAHGEVPHTILKKHE